MSKLIWPGQRDADEAGAWVRRFMTEMHRHDGGRTIPLLHAARLTTPRLAVLELARRPGTVSALADQLGLSRPATSQLVDRLVRGGLLLRSEGARDRRERTIALSARGKALVDRVADARAARFDAALAPLPPQLRERLAAVLEEVVGALAGREEAGR